MTTKICQKDYWELFAQIPETVRKFDLLDDFDKIWKYPQQLGQGYFREIELRSGLWLAIANYQLHDDLIIKSPDRDHPLEYTFFLSGSHKDKYLAVGTGEYALYGSGTAPKENCEISNKQQILEINVHIEPKVFQSLIADTSQELPKELAHLIKKPDQEYYSCSGCITLAMQLALQQILHCPYQGITKRIYLESKILELTALLIEDLTAQNSKNDNYLLKSIDVDRIYHAKEILFRNLDNPPSLTQLSRQVGLNECTLKRSFREVFGTTAFGYLHQYRLEKAQQLLAAGEMSVTEVARSVGFASRSYFATAFRKKFGINPKEYLTNRKNSL